MNRIGSLKTALYKMSEVDQVLPWTGLKPSPLDEEELRIGVHPWLRTESLTDQRSLSERALR